jgi:hypothetical protein
LAIIIKISAQRPVSSLLLLMILAASFCDTVSLHAVETERTVPKGNRLLGCAVTEAGNHDYDAAMKLALAKNSK